MSKVRETSCGPSSFEPNDEVYVYEDKTYDLEDVKYNINMYPRYMKKVRAQNYRYGNIPYIPTPEEQKERR